MNNESVVSLKELDQYTNNWSDTCEDIQMKDTMLKSAQRIVEEFLGYRLEPKHLTEKHIGINQNTILTNAMPVTNVWSVKVNGKDIPCYEHGVSSVTLPFRVCDGSEIVIDYDTGWQTVPELIKMSILRIAALLLTEANGNIGITSKSFGDNSRNFLNFTNFQKYLDPLSAYRIFRM